MGVQMHVFPLIPKAVIARTLIIIAIFLPFDIVYGVERNDDEDIRKKLFKKLETPECQQIPASPTGIVSLDIRFNEFILKTVTALKQRNYDAFEPLFHPKLGFKRDYIAQIFAKIEGIYGPKFESSVYRLWALNTVDGSPITLDCMDPPIQLHALYGYNLQFVLWLQVMGQELGRIYLPIVYAKGNWHLGGLHAHQWTHEGKNFLDWADIAHANNQKGEKLAAYFEYDLAKKLGFGDRFFNLKEMEKITSDSETNLSLESFESQIKSKLIKYPVEYASPLFVRGGAGLLVRLRIPKEISLVEIKSRCQLIKEDIKKMPWTKNLAGIRCSFILPNEDSSKEGTLGGIFVDI